MAKDLYVIAGPNGAGKTTFAREFLPHFANCDVFVNADLIATGLSPFSPRAEAIQAARIVLKRIQELTSRGETFGLETTLSGKSYLELFKRLKKKGYRIHLFFLWLPDVNLAIQRVHDRVTQGGHSVPDVDIKRRFERGLKHFFASNYRLWIDDWVIFQNLTKPPTLVAFGKGDQKQIIKTDLFEQMQRRSAKAL